MQGASWLAGLCFLLVAGTVQALELGKQRSAIRRHRTCAGWKPRRGTVARAGTERCAAARPAAGQPLSGHGVSGTGPVVPAEPGQPVRHRALVPRAGRPHLDYLDLYVYDPRAPCSPSAQRRPVALRGPPLPPSVGFPCHSPASATVPSAGRGDNVIDFPLSIRAPDEFNQHDGT